MTMSRPEPSRSQEIDHLLRNAQLRDELEPLYDESIGRVNSEVMPTPAENEFLALMLAWERAPMLPISKWFEPELKLPHPETLSAAQLHALLWQTIRHLFDQRVVLDFTDHLSDYELYRLLYRDILPSHEKKIDRSDNYLHWDCAGMDDDPETWLRYYATDEERQSWADETGGILPPHEEPPFPRNLPKAPL
jgi:hypothetical protein